jgi:hypothetical protein
MPTDTTSQNTELLFLVMPIDALLIRTQTVNIGNDMMIKEGGRGKEEADNRVH